MRVALFVTCLADAMFPAVGQATVAVLERLGHQVVFPEAQTCCAQMHINTGYRAKALPLVRHHADAFDGLGRDFDAIVAPSGSCVGSVRHQHEELAHRASEHRRAARPEERSELGDDAGNDALASRVARIAASTYELSEFLVDVLGVTDVGAYFPHRVTYHPTCHSLRVLRVDDKPLRLLRAVRGIDLVELPRAEECCGFGGTFALKNSDTSTAMLADKMSHVLGTGAEVLTAGDSSCLMHIGGGLSRLRAGARTLHLAEILASAEQASGEPAVGRTNVAGAR